MDCLGFFYKQSWLLWLGLYISPIRNGSFAREWAGEVAGGYPNFQRVRGEAAAHPINEADKSIRNAFQRTKVESQSRSGGIAV